MPKVTIEAELSERLLRAYQQEAERKGLKVEELIEKTVNNLIAEMERDIDDHPIWVS